MCEVSILPPSGSSQYSRHSNTSLIHNIWGPSKNFNIFKSILGKYIHFFRPPSLPPRKCTDQHFASSKTRVLRSTTFIVKHQKLNHLKRLGVLIGIWIVTHKHLHITLTHHSESCTHGGHLSFKWIYACLVSVLIVVKHATLKPVQIKISTRRRLIVYEALQLIVFLYLFAHIDAKAHVQCHVLLLQNDNYIYNIPIT